MDLNADGSLDVVAGNGAPAQSGASQQDFVLLNDGRGTFGPEAYGFPPRFTNREHIELNGL